MEKSGLKHVVKSLIFLFAIIYAVAIVCGTGLLYWIALVASAPILGLWVSETTIYVLLYAFPALGSFLYLSAFVLESMLLHTGTINKILRKFK